ncbi:MAG: glycosyltransferase family 39 protein, partial [Bacteroidia bacterium]|nr:glycosyltransferase family 39 protein [Bacteroidia bacterium]
MIDLVLILILVLGWLLYTTFATKFDFVESLGLAHLFGLGATAFSEFLLTISGIGINYSSLLVALIMGIIALAILQTIQWKKGQSCLQNLKWQNFEIGSINIIWLAGFGVLLFTLYAITAKSMFWITFATDSVTSFDLYAKAIASEGNLLNSLIHNRAVGYGVAYPPLYSMLLAIPYIYGAETSKIIPALFFIGMIVSFYGLLKKITNPTSAMLFTLFMAITPEMLAQSAINITNGAQAAFSSIGVISLMLWLRNGQKEYFWMSALLLALNGFTRSEGIVYILPAIFVVLVWRYKDQDWKSIGSYAFITLIPFVIWQVFMRINHELMDPFSQIDLHITPNLDGEKLSEIYQLMKFNLSQRTYYGITVILFGFTLVANLWFIIKKKDSWSLLFITISA